MAKSTPLDRLPMRLVSNFKNDLLEKHLTSSKGQSIQANHEDLANKCIEYLNYQDEQRKSIIQMFKKYMLKDFLNQDETKLLDSADKKAVDSFYESNKPQINLPNTNKNNKLNKLQDKINSIYKESSNGNLHNKAELDKIENLNYKINRMSEEFKSDMFEKYSFSNVDNLIKNMHLFDEKVNQKKAQLDANKTNNMLSNLSGLGGNLDMLFSSVLTTDNKKSELPKDLKNFVDRLSNRMPKDVETC